MITDYDKHPPENITIVGRDEKNMAVVAHLSPLSGLLIPGASVVAPLMILLFKREQSPFIGHHAREALNFQITIVLAVAIWFALKLIAVGLLLLPLIPVILIAVLVFMIRAALKAGDGEYYCYPFTLRLVK